MSKSFKFLLIVTILFCKNNLISSEKCERLSACSCVLPNGQGYDFSELSNLSKEGFMISPPLKNSNNGLILFSPCRDLKDFKLNNTGTLKTDECSVGASLCAIDNLVNTTKAENYGDTVHSSIEHAQDGMPFLKFQTKTQKTIIYILCKPSAKKYSFVVLSEEDGLELIIESQYGCQKQLNSQGLSTGSVLVILLFVFSSVYLVGGALLLKFLRGATGMEMIPNYGFWCNFSQLVKEGIAFTFAGCKEDSYDRI